MRDNRPQTKSAIRVMMATNALELGGAETHIIELTRGLRRLGCEVSVASAGGELVAELKAAGAVAHHRLPLDRRAVFPLLQSFFGLLRLVRRERPDILHAHARIPAIVMGLAAKLYRIPLVTTVHWTFDLSGWKRKFSWWSPYSIAVSEDLLDYLVKNFNFQPQQVAVIPNGINTELFTPVSPVEHVYGEFGWEPGDVVIIHVSRLTGDIAGPAFKLLRAVKVLGKEIPALRLLVAGDGDRKVELEELAGEVNCILSRPVVRIAGQRNDLPRLLPPAAVFVGVSRAALEAMACARPVILAGSQGYMGFFNPEMLPEAVRTNFTGRGHTEVSEDLLLRDLRKVLIEMSETERQESGRFNRQVVEENYSSQIMAEKTHQFYQSVISEFSE